ncbi:MAG: hypothetical protein DWH79_01130 [Planctomycetota bacterium]|nr:MAG: hypothetical protein DWH79_01130 [Planctomycetota bacterium]
MITIHHQPIVLLTAAQRAALARIAYATEQPSGVVLLCGAAGVGKTLILASVRNSPGGEMALLPLEQLLDSLRVGEPLPGILLVDDAHLAPSADLAEAVERSVGRCLVLAGRGRLLTLAGRDSRIDRRVRLRATLPPFGLSDSARLVVERIPGADGHGPSEEVVRTFHEIAAGIPAALLRLIDLAAVVAAAEPLQTISVNDVEEIHRRLCLQAA